MNYKSTHYHPPNPSPPKTCCCCFKKIKILVISHKVGHKCDNTRRIEVNITEQTTEPQTKKEPPDWPELSILFQRFKEAGGIEAGVSRCPFSHAQQGWMEGFIYIIIKKTYLPYSHHDQQVPVSYPLAAQLLIFSLLAFLLMSLMWIPLHSGLFPWSFVSLPNNNNNKSHIYSNN